MTYNNHTGMWFPDLPDHCHVSWAFYDQVLHQALTGSSANLGDSDSTRHLISEFSGYQILWLLAYIAGHPGVCISVSQPRMPHQRRDTSFHDYMQLWSHFLHLEYTRGVAYSDVFFVECWLEHLHSTFNDNLKPLILSFLRDCRRDVPVPIHFSPEHLVTYVCTRAGSIGMYSLTPMSTPSSFSSSGQGRRSGAIANTRQLDAGPTLLDVRLLDEELPSDVFASVCSLMATAQSRTCDLCQSSDHLVASCPILRRVIDDPSKARRLLAIVEQSRSSRGGSPQRPSPQSRPSSRARTPPASNRTADARALDLHDEDTDEDVSIRQLTDDEYEPHGDHENQPDFP